MMILEYKIKCPDCGSVSTLVTEEATPVIYECPGCGKNVVMHGVRVYTVSREFMQKIRMVCKSTLRSDHSYYCE